MTRKNPAASGPATPAPGPRLDNLTLSRKEGWFTFVDSPARPRPDDLTLKELAALGESALAAHNRARRKCHANIGPLKTPMIERLHGDLWNILDSNEQDGDKAKPSAAVDALAGLGKTTAVNAFGKAYHRREIAELGKFTDAGHERIPVCRIGLAGNTGIKDLNRSMLAFYGHPGSRNGTASQFIDRAMDCALARETTLLIFDETHFLPWGSKEGTRVSNHFKHLANELPVTIIFVGIGLGERGLYSEGRSSRAKNLAQLGRRVTPLPLDPYLVDDDRGREEWRVLLKAVEKRLVLARKFEGMLADDLSDYLFARSTGHLASLMTLIARGCSLAIKTGEERLTADLLDCVRNDANAERARAELEAALAKRRATTIPKGQAA